MHVRQLTYFIQVAEFGSISAAAAYLKVAQPAVSRQILRLEQELGATLVVRHGRGVSLTEAGRCLLEHARVILVQTEKIRHDIASLSSLPDGEVTLGVPAMVGPILVPPLLHRVRKAYPGVHLHVVQDLSEELRKALLRRSVDVGIFHCNKPSASFVCEVLLQEDLHLIGPPGGVSSATETEFRMIADLPLVLPPRTHELRQLIEETAAGIGIGLRVEYELDAIAVIKEVVRKEGLYTIFPPAAAWPELEQGCLAVSRLCAPTVARPLVLATLPTGLSAAARLIARIARQEFEQLVQCGRWIGSAVGPPARSFSQPAASP